VMCFFFLEMLIVLCVMIYIAGPLLGGVGGWVAFYMTVRTGMYSQKSGRF